MDVDPSQISSASVYQHLIRVISPRPIAWVSTVSRDGRYNLAPYSFFSGAGSRPPSVVFCPANRRDGSSKDTLQNILETGEFVINVVPFLLAEAMNLTSAGIPSDESEFDLAGLAMAESRTVKPSRVADSPVCLECRLMHHWPLADGPGGANIVVGRVEFLHIADWAVDESGFADPGLLDLVGRLGGQSYCRTTDRFDLDRPRTP